MDLRSVVSLIRTRLLLIVACVAIVTGVAFAASLVLPPTYEASTEIVAGPALTTNVTDVNQLQTAQQIAATYAAVVQTQQLAQQVVNTLGLPLSADDLLKEVNVNVSSDAPVITIKVDDPSATRSAAIANAVAQQLITRSSDISGVQALMKSIQDQIDTIQGQLTADEHAISALQAKPQPLSDADQASLVQLQQDVIANQTNLTSLLTSQSTMSANPLTIIDPAVVPTDKASPKLLLNTALGFVLGLVLGLGAAFGGAALDDTFKTVDELRHELDLPVLGTLGRLPEAAQRSGIYSLVMLLYPRSAAAEAFRTMRTNVEFTDIDSGLRSILVTSPATGDGKSTVAANLALAFAQAGRRTVLVDADLRKPSIHSLFDLTNTFGLTTLIRSEVISLPQVIRKVDEPNLRVLTSGPLPPNPAELLGSNRMRGIIEALKADADLVVFDTPPSAAVTDAAVLASLIDGTILVVAANATRRQLVRTVDESLTRVGGRIIGVVVNRLTGRGHEETYEPYAAEPDAIEVGAADLSHA
ncbi:MAG TPA: polysaccharide biosynthesis tyrosine autokinase, partial [Candidatus Sulfotelmatobacter sp.]|nr:polysaccharide biosynthesis tyrosine autokinase [Candidatus Sulfotelmatobacter sp.]